MMRFPNSVRMLVLLGAFLWAAVLAIQAPERTALAQVCGAGPCPTDTPVQPTSTREERDDATRRPTATPLPVLRATATPTRVNHPLFPGLDLQGPPTLSADYPPAPTPAFPISNTIPYYDIEILNVEITQGIQNLDNMMNLVFHRQTVVRVYFQIRDLSFQPGDEVTNSFRVEGAMKITDTGLAFTPPVLDIIPGEYVHRSAGNWGDDDTWESDRLSYSSTINFALPKDWSAGNMEYEIFIWGNDVTKKTLGPETDYSNNRATLNAEYIGGVEKPKLILYTMHNHLEGDSSQAVKDLLYKNTAAMQQAIIGLYRYFPISDVTLITSPLFYLRPIGHPLDSHTNDWDPDEKGEINKELDRLVWIKNNSGGYPAGNAVIWYGMIHEDVALHWWNDDDVELVIGGLAGGGAAVGYMNAPTLAHEAGHNFGLPHIFCAGNENEGGEIDPDFPYGFPGCSLWEIDPNGFYGLDMERIFQGLGNNFLRIISNDPVMAANLGYPLMSYAGSPWIDPLHYCKVMNNLGGFCQYSDIGLAALGAEAVAGLDWLPQLHGDEQDGPPDYLLEADQYLLVSGSYNTEAQQAEFWQAQVHDELTENAWATASAAAADRHYREENDLLSPYRLTLVDATEGELFAVALYDSNYLSAHASGQTVSFFEVLPFYETVTALVIRDEAGNELARRSVSAGTPTVTILTPNDGGEASLPLELAWVARDPDGDALTYMIQYSPDNGTSWITLITDYAEQSALLETTQGLQSSPEGLFRVVASDGVLTGSDVIDAPLTLPNNAPTAFITGPAAETVYATNAEVRLNGQAYDWEEGELADAALVWSSDIDGELGQGTEIIRYDLTPGIHLVTLTATDSAGLQGVTSQYIVVDPNTRSDTYDPETLDWARQVMDGELVLETQPIDSDSESATDGLEAKAPISPLVWGAAGLLLAGLAALLLRRRR